MNQIEIGNQSYPIAWGNLAKMRFTTIPQHVREATGPAAVAAMAWACIAAKPNPFPTWEHLAEQVSFEQAPKLLEQLNVLFEEPDAEKKSDSESGPSPESVSV